VSALPGDYTPPARGILSVKPYQDEHGPGFEVFCDCGTTTCVVVEDAHLLTEAREMAFTCAGCSSVTWFTVGPVGQPGTAAPS
jgi:hypothetical protein